MRTACFIIEKAPEMTAWLAITVAAVASSTSGSSAQSGAIRKNGFSRRLGVRQHQRPLPEVGQRQRRPDEPQPGEPDRLLPEVAEVGIERLGPGHGQEDRAQHDQRRPVPLASR